MSDPAPAWPELESSSATAPEWTLRSESELHVERLEAKLAIIQKRARPSHKSDHATLNILPPELLEPDADEIQEGQEEADEGLWLLWNSKAASSPTERSIPAEETSPDDIEARLDRAKANARHVDEYMYNKDDRSCHSRVCCCIIS
ncbi:hypothetical protein EMPS_02630 [Entomortierella parvispora]|uniref:Uncharacterized protein n=1 Tax=Entomortierella parvispora TaxID=205924 RepID=A0A9P3H533_9FUNG|nr:hypothetical protein EMPS_02630 [Entomortierella parvispora]